MFRASSLAAVTTDSRYRNANDWLTQYSQPQFASFSSLVYNNTLLGTLATDHRFVYAVDDLAVPAPAQIFQWMWNQGQGISNDLKPLVMQNCLYAFNVQSGRGEWKLGDMNGRDEEFKDSHFLGVPMSVGGKLYVLNEIDRQTTVGTNPVVLSSQRMIERQPVPPSTGNDP